MNCIVILYTYISCLSNQTIYLFYILYKKETISHFNLCTFTINSHTYIIVIAYHNPYLFKCMDIICFKRKFTEQIKPLNNTSKQHYYYYYYYLYIQHIYIYTKPT